MSKNCDFCGGKGHISVNTSNINILETPVSPGHGYPVGTAHELARSGHNLKRRRIVCQQNW